MLQVQDAVKSSLEMLGKVFPPGDVQEPRLEEVALTDDEQYWLVTVSFSNPDYEKEHEDVAEENKTLANLLLSLRTPRRRVTKTIKVRANDGSLVEIKNQWPS